MNFEEMTAEQLEERRAAIAAEIDNPEADLDALEEEARSIKEELETRKAAEAKRAEIRSAVATGEGETIVAIKEETRGEEMSNVEVRASKEYIDAFARYIKTGKDEECRSLLTENVNGVVPVPTIVEGRVRTAWENNGLMSLVRKTYIRGNVKIGFELSATGAVVHTEGTAAPAEEELTLGVVSMIPASIKKWITISDEAIDLGGEEFLNYIYDELTYQITKKAASELIRLIETAPAESTATAAGVPTVAGAPSDLAVVAKASAALSSDAGDITVVMNRQSHADVITAIASNNYLFDPFENVRVEYNNDLPAYSAAEAGATWMIVGDFGYGAQANFPNGDEVTVKYDDLSLAESDMVKLVGREYVALGIVAPNAFVKVTKAEG